MFRAQSSSFSFIVFTIDAYNAFVLAEGFGYNQWSTCGRWCAPYAYKMRQEIGCGGADKWTVIPGGAFPGYTWSHGSGNLFCESGHYCPNATAQVPTITAHCCAIGTALNQGISCVDMVGCLSHAWQLYHALLLFSDGHFAKHCLVYCGRSALHACKVHCVTCH